MYENSCDKSKHSKDSRSEYEVRCSIFKTLGVLKASEERLEREKNEYIGEAREAERRNDDVSYAAAKKKLRLCLINMKLVTEMICELELTLALDSMDRMIERYNSCVDTFKKRRSFMDNPHNVGKRMRERKNDIERVLDQYAELYDSLSGKGKGAMKERGDKMISDDELERIISQNEMREEESYDSMNAAIEAKLEMIKKRIKED